jgi:acetyl-CoA carboxylase carboxyltransferase component
MEEVAVQKQHAKLKLTARERVNILFDEGTSSSSTPSLTGKGVKKSQNAYGDGSLSAAV